MPHPIHIRLSHNSEPDNMNGNSEKSRILVIVSPSEVDPLSWFLQSENLIVEVLVERAATDEPVPLGDFDLAIIDGLPRGASGVGGFEILRRIRQRSLLPVLMISDCQGEAERVLALELGADDY